MNFTIYTTNWCSYCKAAKQLLSLRGFDFEEINLEEKEMNREDLYDLTRGRTVPQIMMDGKPIGGFEDLQKLDAEGKLNAKLESAN
ncbi:MAG: glutaredoxin domain-containing protein [Candidatus Marinimicrobia bacterium]|jgi:glutaredoxin 3|nr:glutaredoxin domain-containing protein [Candidatus Neomarinimicrobiota bacterium]|tara:strand:- start:38 stop:295 length:258 start_codon:yes stop_codon:yes gene_type:complete